MQKLHPAKYWHKLNGKIQCDLCPHNCILENDKHGICLARICKNQELFSLVYGVTSGLGADPIEKKPLYHFYPGSKILSFGSFGCNLKCKFCQNWQLSTVDDLPIINYHTADEIVKITEDEKCKSIAFTYNEPVISIEYVHDVAVAAHKKNIKTVMVTSGFINPKPRADLYAHIDAANVDLKGFTEEFYKNITSSQLQPVLDTLIYLKDKTKTWFEVTTLLIPGLNDNEKDLQAQTRWLYENLGPDVPLHFTAFFPCYKLKDRQPTPSTTLIKAREIALSNGLHYVYAGNINVPEVNSTYCVNCKKNIISRSGLHIANQRITAGGLCEFCGYKCAGVM